MIQNSCLKQKTEQKKLLVAMSLVRRRLERHEQALSRDPNGHRSGSDRPINAPELAEMVSAIIKDLARVQPTSWYRVETHIEIIRVYIVVSPRHQYNRPREHREI